MKSFFADTRTANKPTVESQTTHNSPTRTSLSRTSSSSSISESFHINTKQAQNYYVHACDPSPSPTPAPPKLSNSTKMINRPLNTTNKNNKYSSSSSSLLSSCSNSSSNSLISNSNNIPINKLNANISNKPTSNCNNNIINININNDNKSRIRNTSPSAQPMYSMKTNTTITTASKSSLTSLPSTTTSQSSSKPLKRFIVFEDGSHQHSLKCVKRQEKLSHMIKNIMGSEKKKNNAVSALPEIMQDSKSTNKQMDPPTLFAGMMKQISLMQDPLQERKSSAAKDSVTKDSASKDPATFNLDSGKLFKTSADLSKSIKTPCFSEKYGRCQEIVGRGAFGVVRICHKKRSSTASTSTNATPELFAVKEFKRKQSESYEKYSKRLTSEFCISSSLKHPNIIATFDLFQDTKGDFFEVMEFCSGGDLFSLIVSAGKLEYAEADCFFKQLIRGVIYMHEMGVCHRDLKPENLMLSANGTLKIVDFGNSECFKMAWEENIHLIGGICGSSPYIAPEEYTRDEFDPRPVDIWACGVIYMAMRTGRQLWEAAKKDDEFYLKYLKGRKEKDGYQPIEQLKRARCRNVIYSMLDPVPSRRINGKQVLNSEWIREVRCCNDTATTPPK
ncbi:hypothetical protein TBLA_0C00720 [Henningerozyma blattae CBS 6284]|uniref:non-specific serine/threonine protein kinase n=1 Tax=Henningerozyma blattae (strain ATCC 34711 / CBS 6284 / DSM 70876 / NBRC 10599 / NRRL Y-10934 / UCD 77-7) TaxID=1071380 RepID=I2H0I6_HENB6|nr:hypothetical protein TBLA_0C00720 [Tetrapisispora blattae CBS 6284]CCH59888.1 hypothetical protein TBLA_0C00720 [Tetrapisispora blattae CBS 6284]